VKLFPSDFLIGTLTPGLTADDIHRGTAKFWAFQIDPVMAIDLSCWTIVATHANLTIGTLCRYLEEFPYLQPLVESLLRFDTFGVYLLTERGHGLDAFNIETTATKTREGFILNTPNEAATK